MEAVHVNLLGATIGVVDPEEGADALAVRAGGHALGDLELILEVPWALIVNGEDDEVFWLYVVHVGLVSDTDCATSNVLNVVRVNDGCRLTGTCEVGVLTVIATTLLETERV